MAFTMSDKAQIIEIFNLRADTNEYIGRGEAYISPHTGLPAHSTDVTPPDIPSGKVAVFNSSKKKWCLIEDYRGLTVYNTKTAEPICISVLGALPNNVTTIAPDGEYQNWNGTAWVTDLVAMYTNKAESERQRLLTEANTTIADWLIDLQLGMISEQDKTRLKSWWSYIKNIKELDLSEVKDEARYQAIIWPVSPR